MNGTMDVVSSRIKVQHSGMCVSATHFEAELNSSSRMPHVFVHSHVGIIQQGMKRRKLIALNTAAAVLRTVLRRVSMKLLATDFGFLLRDSNDPARCSGRHTLRIPYTTTTPGYERG